MYRLKAYEMKRGNSIKKETVRSTNGHKVSITDDEAKELFRGIKILPEEEVDPEPTELIFQLYID